VTGSSCRLSVDPSLPNTRHVPAPSATGKTPKISAYDSKVPSLAGVTTVPLCGLGKHAGDVCCSDSAARMIDATGLKFTDLGQSLVNSVRLIR